MNAAYFVDGVHGNDANSGRREDKAWRAIQKAADVLGPGDTAYIMSGLYNERVVPANSGELYNPLVFTVLPYHEAVLDGTGVAVGDEKGLFEIQGKEHIKVAGLTVLHAGHFGILAENSKHIVIHQNHTYDTWSSGIHVWKCQDVVVGHNEVELACSPGGQECLSIVETDGFIVLCNHIHHSGPGNEGVASGGEGLDLKQGVKNGAAIGNRIHHVVSIGFYVDGALEGAENIDVCGNLVYSVPHAGFAIANERGGLVADVRVHNNIGYRCGHAGLAIGDWPSSVEHPMDGLKIVNNTFWKNGVDQDWTGGGIWHTNAEATNTLIRNNLCAENNAFQIALDGGSTAVHDNNLCWPYRGHLREKYGEIEADPLLVSPLCYVNPDFHLQPASPAIGVGDGTDAPDDDFDGVSRPQGVGYDIGAHEYPVPFQY